MKAPNCPKCGKEMRIIQTPHMLSRKMGKILDSLPYNRFITNQPSIGYLAVCDKDKLRHRLKANERPAVI